VPSNISQEIPDTQKGPGLNTEQDNVGTCQCSENMLSIKKYFKQDSVSIHVKVQITF